MTLSLNQTGAVCAVERWASRLAIHETMQTNTFFIVLIFSNASLARGIGERQTAHKRPSVNFVMRGMWIGPRIKINELEQKYTFAWIFTAAFSAVLIFLYFCGCKMLVCTYPWLRIASFWSYVKGNTKNSAERVARKHFCDRSKRSKKGARVAYARFGLRVFF